MNFLKPTVGVTGISASTARAALLVVCSLAVTAALGSRADASAPAVAGQYKCGQLAQSESQPFTIGSGSATGNLNAYGRLSLTVIPMNCPGRANGGVRPKGIPRVKIERTQPANTPVIVSRCSWNSRAAVKLLVATCPIRLPTAERKKDFTLQFSVRPVGFAHVTWEFKIL